MGTQMTPTVNPIKRHRERCRETRSGMSDYLDGELDVDAAARLEHHVRWCPNCRRMLENLRRTIGGLRSLRDQDTPAHEARPQREQQRDSRG
jgi:anti-sigma factor RsiW